MAENNLSFEKLMNSIKEINTKAGSMAKRAVNQLMTLRNWWILETVRQRRMNSLQNLKS